MKTKSTILAILTSFFISTSINAEIVTTYVLESDFQDVNETLTSEIESSGIVISYTSHAQKMLERTAKQINPEYNTYTDALIHLFCTAGMAHKMTLANPHILPLCPYSISVYKLTETPDRVYLSYNNSDNEVYAGVITLLMSIIVEIKAEYE